MQQKHLLRVEEMQRADWLTCLGMSKFVARQVVFDEKRATKPKFVLKVDPGSSFRNNFLQPTTNIGCIIIFCINAVEWTFICALAGLMSWAALANVPDYMEKSQPS